MARVVLDLNNPEFQKNWFALEREEQLAVLATLGKIQQMEWDQLYRDRGLHWEAIQSRSGPNDRRIYSLRVTRRSRAVAYRDGDVLRFLTVHADHDAAYRK
ncbi:MAG TPA: hypothetical protein VKR43_10660 [Bryobacteraceae bacterium]|nr:hypothetical protein [Bryobacteraceae bacterium]